MGAKPSSAAKAGAFVGSKASNPLVAGALAKVGWSHASAADAAKLEKPSSAELAGAAVNDGARTAEEGAVKEGALTALAVGALAALVAVPKGSKELSSWKAAKEATGAESKDASNPAAVNPTALLADSAC